MQQQPPPQQRYSQEHMQEMEEIREEPLKILRFSSAFRTFMTNWHFKRFQKGISEGQRLVLMVYDLVFQG